MEESAAFVAAERFVEGSIAGLLVPLWLLAASAHLAGPHATGMRRKFGLKLAADLWSTLYGAVRDLLLLTVFLASLLYLYPDVVMSNELPVTGGLAGSLALAALVHKLVSSGSDRGRGQRIDTAIVGLGAALYVVPYVLGPQLTSVPGSVSDQLTSVLVSSRNPTLALVLCHTAQEIVAVLGAIAVFYTLRQPVGREASAAARARRPQIDKRAESAPELEGVQ